jgi:argininosuccinate lyase
MAKQAQATWGGRFSAGPAELMLRFSESVSFDRRLAPFDIAGSKAHAAMLAQVGLITKKERDAIHRGLDAVGRDIAAGTFKWQTKLEDVHMNIEQALTQRVPAAAKLHTARSRNDQVATDMRLYFKAACAEIIEKITAAQRAILQVAAKNRDVLIPGYTHLQRAQPVFLAHHLFTYLEMLQRDAQRFAVVADHANWCPLGSGAIAGTTLPIDREFTAKLLGFVDTAGRPRVTQNSMDAVSDRDAFIEFASACALTGVHFSRMAEDLILWASQEFKFVELPDAFCTGSSLMPQKKNPDSAELLRGKSARLQGNLHTLLVLAKGLPLTYNRDLQEDKPPVFDSHDQTALCLDVLAGTFAGLVVEKRQVRRRRGGSRAARDRSGGLSCAAGRGVPRRAPRGRRGREARRAKARRTRPAHARRSEDGPPGLRPRLGHLVPSDQGHGAPHGHRHARPGASRATVQALGKVARVGLYRGNVEECLQPCLSFRTQ